MHEAAQTNVSTTGIWVIVVVSVACLAFWLGAVALASRDPGVRHRRTPDTNRRMPDMMGPVLGGTHVSDCRRSVAPSRSSEATFADTEAKALLGAGVPGPRVPDAAPVPTGQQAAGQPEAPVVPAQQTGDADQPRRANTGG